MNNSIIQISFFLIVSIILVVVQNKLYFRNKCNKDLYNKRKIIKVLDISFEILMLIFIIYLILLDYISLVIPFLFLVFAFKKIIKGRALD
jgi:hypothetical protein